MRAFLRQLPTVGFPAVSANRALLLHSRKTLLGSESSYRLGTMGNLCGGGSKADSHKKLDDAAAKEEQDEKAPAGENKLQTVFDKPTGNIEDDYTLGENLGQPGQYGRAQKCLDKKTGKEYAVKVMNLSRFRSNKRAKTVFDNFRNEFMLMQQLDHPNIIKAQKAYETKTELYFVMELCTGGELFDRISSRKSYSEKDAQVVLRQIMEGLDYMHSKKIAHCDLKPDNFLFLDAREDAPVKIIDFGFAKFTDADHYLSNIAGTCFYMAPEVLEGSYSFHADVWSMGVVMYIMLFGYPPFNSRQQGAAMHQDIKRKIRQGFEPVEKEGFGPWFPSSKPVSAAAKDLMSKMMVLDSAARLSAREVLEHSWMTGKDASAEPLEHVLKNIHEFNGKFALKKKLLGCLSAALTETEIMELEKAFKKLDADGNGYLTLAELKKGAEAEGKSSVGMEKLKTILEGADVDGDGQLSYHELVMGATHRKLVDKEERLKIVFAQLDTDNSGWLSREEVIQVLQTTQEEATKMIEEVDKDKDGRINYNEFIEMWRGKEKIAGHDYAEFQKELSQYA